MYYSNENVLFIIHNCIICYRKFKDFINDAFLKDLKTLLSKPFNEETIPFEALRESVHATLEKHASSKTRYTRAHQAPYMNKKLSKEIMKRSRQRNKFLNIKSELDRKAYNKQRNMWLIYREKKKTNFMVIFNGNFLNRK